MGSFGTDGYIEKIVQRHSKSMLRAAYTVLHSTADAEDAVQEAFIKLMEKRPHLSDDEHAKAWLLRVTLNISKNMLRSRKAEALDETFASETDNDNSDLLRAVLSLPERYSTVVHLYYYEGYSIKEIAGILRLPAATVGTRLSRARALLKDYLTGECEND